MAEVCPTQQEYACVKRKPIVFRMGDTINLNLRVYKGDCGDATVRIDVYTSLGNATYTFEQQ